MVSELIHVPMVQIWILKGLPWRVLPTFEQSVDEEIYNAKDVTFYIPHPKFHSLLAPGGFGFIVFRLSASTITSQLDQHVSPRSQR